MNMAETRVNADTESVKDDADKENIKKQHRLFCELIPKS